MQDYLTHKRREESAQKSRADANLANFQFVDAINSLMAKNYDDNCNRFSLKDKAHVRQMILAAKDGAVKDSKLLKERQRECQEMEVEADIVNEILGQNSALRRILDQFDEALQEQTYYKQTEEARRAVLLKELDVVKAEFQDLVARRQAKENALEARCKESLNVLASTRENLRNQIDSLEVQLQTRKLQDDVNLQTLTAAHNSALTKLEAERGDMNIKIEQLRFASKQFIREKEREHDEIKREWDSVMKRREDLLIRLDELRKGENDRLGEIRRLKEEKVQAEQGERVRLFDIECQIRNKKYSLEEKAVEQRVMEKGSGAKSEATRDDEDIDEGEYSGDSVERKLEGVVRRARQKFTQMHGIVELLGELTKPGTEREKAALRSQAAKLMNTLL